MLALPDGTRTAEPSSVPDTVTPPVMVQPTQEIASPWKLETWMFESVPLATMAASMPFPPPRTDTPLTSLPWSMAW